MGHDKWVWRIGIFSLLMACGNASHKAQAGLLVYEPFAYADGNLNDQSGALGTVGSWTSFDYLQDSWPIPQDGWRVHQEGDISGVYLSDANPSNDPIGPNPWDGVVDNLATLGGYVGLAGPDDTDDPDPFSGEPGRWMDASISLHPDVTATFVSGTTTWFSFISVRGWDRNEESPQFMISTDPSPDNARGRFLENDGNGIGGGGSPTRANFGDVFPAYFQDGVNNHTPGGYQDGELGEHDGIQDEIAPNPDSNGALDSDFQTMIWEELDDEGEFAPANLVVGKIEWDADTAGEDIVSVVRFLESDTISESAFDDFIEDRPPLSSINWDSNKPDLEQSEFDTINFSGTKFFIDEIRIGQSLSDVTPSNNLEGDYDNSGELDTADLDLQAIEISDRTNNLAFDLTGDGFVNGQDREEWVVSLANTWFGDADLDGVFNTSDFVTVFQAGRFETGESASWTQGDWNGDRRFTSADFVKAFQDGGFEQGARTGALVPEPSTLGILLTGLLGLLVVRRSP